MDERDKSLAEEQAKETAAAAEISAAETEGSEDEIVLPPKRGRGRPPKNPKSDEEEDRRPEVPACPGNDPDNVSDEVPSETDEAEEPTITQSNDYTYDQHGMRFIAELVRQQNQAQEGMIRAQTEFSNSVMDRMDDYRIQMSKLQSEVAEKEKNRLRADYLAAQDKADEYMEEIHQLRDQLDGANRKAVKLSAKLESLTAENESLRQQVRSLKEQWEEVEKGKSTQQQIFPEMTAYQYPPEGFWKRRRRRRFLEKVYQNSSFSEEQLQVICDADRMGIPFERLVQICSPDIPAENMKLKLDYSKR
jgi:uncharacterized phage infection (PIP) family protein YhgE